MTFLSEAVYFAYVLRTFLRTFWSKQRSERHNSTRKDGLWMDAFRQRNFSKNEVKKRTYGVVSPVGSLVAGVGIEPTASRL